MRNIRVGLLGFGAMGKTHSYCIDNLKYFFGELPFSASVVGICSSSESKSVDIAKKFGFGKAYANEDDLIADDNIDVIDICTPNALHYETLKKAIAAGKAIYCEKPLCLNYAQAAKIAALAESSCGFCGL